jgi:hypothetical protein
MTETRVSGEINLTLGLLLLSLGVKVRVGVAALPFWER